MRGQMPAIAKSPSRSGKRGLQAPEPKPDGAADSFPAGLHPPGRREPSRSAMTVGCCRWQEAMGGRFLCLLPCPALRGDAGQQPKQKERPDPSLERGIPPCADQRGRGIQSGQSHREHGGTGKGSKFHGAATAGPVMMVCRTEGAPQRRNRARHPAKVRESTSQPMMP